MTPKELIFHQTLAANNYGGRYDHNSDPSAGHSLFFNTFIADAIQLGDAFRASDQCKKPFPELFVGIANCDSLNAGAFRDNNVYYLCLCHGSLDLLAELFRRLICMPSVFRWLGDPSPSAPVPTFPPLPRASSLIAASYIARPIEKRRFDAATWLLGISLKFLLLHEFRHIIGGHIDYASLYFNLNGMNELLVINPTMSSDNLIKQSFEIDADTYGAMTIIALYFSPRPTESFDLQFLAGCNDKREKVLILILTSVLAVIKFLGGEIPPVEYWDNCDHPPNIVRSTAILRVAQYYLERWGHTDLTSRQETITEVLRAIDTTLHELLGYPPLTEEWRKNVEDGGACDTHVQTIKDVFTSIDSELQDLAYVLNQSP